MKIRIIPVASAALAGAIALAAPSVAQASSAPVAGLPATTTHAQVQQSAAALCDGDGPCLEEGDAPGSPIPMYSFNAGNQLQLVTLYYDAGDYGCTEVTATCPFHNRSLDSRHLGQPLVDIQFQFGALCADSYPGNDLHLENCSTAPDRRVYVMASCGSICVYLLSPYWSNANNALEALYGPPLGQTASVNTFTGSTRQQWHGES